MTADDITTRLDEIEARQREATTLMEVGDIAHDDVPWLVAALRDALGEVERLTAEKNNLNEVIGKHMGRWQKAERQVQAVEALCDKADTDDEVWPKAVYTSSIRTALATTDDTEGES